MLSLLFSLSISLDNGLALTPPMGWMAWEQFRCTTSCFWHPKTCISEKLFTQMIDKLVEDNWTKYGYEYINIDDCWLDTKRDSEGRLQPDKSRFPNGIKWLAEYAHKKGVKLGIYNDYGTKTCEGYPGSEGYLDLDARTFAEWDIDMLKMDGCYSNTLDMNDAYPAMSHFLNSTGRQIMFQCSWPAYDQDMDYTPLPPSCNLWRNYGDIRATWASIKDIMNVWADHQDKWAKYAGPGHWNDPDMIVVGMDGGSLTEDESKTQFAIWSILAAPLLMTGDLRVMPQWAKDILMNEEVIAVDQDKLGKQGLRITPKSVDQTVWVRELANGDYAVALMNRGDTTTNIMARFSDFSSVKKFAVRDLYLRKDLGVFTNFYSGDDIPKHGVVMLRLTPKD